MDGCPPNSTHQNCKKEEKEKRDLDLPCPALLLPALVTQCAWPPFTWPLSSPSSPVFLAFDFCEPFPSDFPSRREFCGCEGREAVEGKWRKPVARGGCTKMLGINQSRTPYAGVNWAAAIQYAMLLYLSSNLFLKLFIINSSLAGMNASSSLHYLHLHILFKKSM